MKSEEGGTVHGPSDTSPDVERAMIEGYRRMPATQRWRNLFGDYVMGRRFHKAGFAKRHPGASRRDVQAEWIRHTLGEDCPVPIPEDLVDPVAQDVQSVLVHVLGTFDRLNIAYAIGGSVASSLHGIGRMTRNLDLTAEPFGEKLGPFVAAFPAGEYYLSEPAVRDAIRLRSSFSILHPPTGYKIDVFVRPEAAFDVAAFARRTAFPFPAALGGSVMVHTAEDTVLFKLRWYRLGGGVSDQQWNDVQGVLKTQTDRLDGTYLRRWAAELGVADLLETALADAGNVT
jgi:hypothetical protein